MHRLATQMSRRNAMQMPLLALFMVLSPAIAIPAETASISEIAPLSGKVGSTVYIHGKNLSGTSHVFFGEFPIKNFRVEAPDVVSAVVPEFPGKDGGVVEVWLIVDGAQVKGRQFEFRPNLSLIR